VLKNKQDEIATLIFEISDDGWSASWYPDIEFIVWSMLQGLFSRKHIGTRYDNPKHMQELRSRLDRLRILSKEVNGWISRLPNHSEESFIPMNEWLIRYESWKQRTSGETSV
jgi:hypothetical protein